jgi:hypothetical protein
MSQGTFVYFIKPVGFDGPIKIGCSRHPTTRLAQLATWSPFPLEVIATFPGDQRDEKFLHGCFVESHTHHEWFLVTPLLKATIEKIVATGSLTTARNELAVKGKISTERQRQRSPDYREFCSYNHRVRFALDRVSKSSGGRWRAPRDVCAILERWVGNSYRKYVGVRPSSEEFDRLEQYLADPAAQSLCESEAA